MSVIQRLPESIKAWIRETSSMGYSHRQMYNRHLKISSSSVRFAMAEPRLNKIWWASTSKLQPTSLDELAQNPTRWEPGRVGPICCCYADRPNDCHQMGKHTYSIWSRTSAWLLTSIIRSISKPTKGSLLRLGMWEDVGLKIGDGGKLGFQSCYPHDIDGPSMRRHEAGML